jgi:hypothetical protein
VLSANAMSPLSGSVGDGVRQVPTPPDKRLVAA